MGVLQVSLACLLLIMNFEPVPAEVFCTECLPGYFTKVNCSTTQRSGVVCHPCTICSAANLETLSECSTYADAVCVNKTTTTTTTPSSTSVTESPPDETVIMIVGVLLVVFVLLLGSVMALLFCRGRCYSKLKGNLLLSPHATLLPLQDKPPPSSKSLHRSGSAATEADII